MDFFNAKKNRQKRHGGDYSLTIMAESPGSYLALTRSLVPSQEYSLTTRTVDRYRYVRATVPSSNAASLIVNEFHNEVDLQSTRLDHGFNDVVNVFHSHS